MVASGVTDVGKTRTINQDCVFVSVEPIGPLPNLFIVADGMGGHNAGDVASRMAVELFCAHIKENSGYDGERGFLDLLMAAAAVANSAVFEASLADDDLSGMGTTFTACVIKGGKCEIAHIGDTRAYQITDKSITQLTADHSYVNEMVKAGQLTAEQAREHPKRNLLTRVLGVAPEMRADGCIGRLEPDSVILLSSDGLTNMLSDEIIHQAAMSAAPPRERAETIVSMANARGGYDNISVVLIDTREAVIK